MLNFCSNFFLHRHVLRAIWVFRVVFVICVADKVKKKYGALGPGVLMATMERGHHGLGMSLAGHKDRSRMAVFVCGLNPAGSAHRTGALRVGDEILEVSKLVFIKSGPNVMEKVKITSHSFV